MKKITCLFEKDNQNRALVINKISSDCEWVIHGEGVATQKFDGTACLVKNGNLYRRYDCKNGKTPPIEFMPCQDPDPITGHWPGWVRVDENTTEKFYLEPSIPDIEGTYELCGPKIQKNPEKLLQHQFIKHGSVLLNDCPRDFDGLKNYFTNKDIEGVVFHHPDGRMAKITLKNFGLERKGK